MRSRLLVAWRRAAGAALALATPAGPAQANGTPIRITLRYLNGVSNFGPQNATGVAELITSEGEVRLTAAGLQKLADNEEYQLWISSDETDERLRLGTVQVNDGGVARLDTVLRQPIPEKPWNLMVLTVEAKGAQPAAPSDQRSIAGRFSMTAEGGGDAPRVLPNTGGDATAGTRADRPARAEQRRRRSCWSCCVVGVHRLRAGPGRAPGGAPEARRKTDDSGTVHRRLRDARLDAADGVRDQQPGERPDGRLQAGPLGALDVRRDDDPPGRLGHAAPASTASWASWGWQPSPRSR